MKKVALHNLGCKVNAYETEAMREQLQNAGFEIVDFNEMADVYIVNTCTVTNMADRKSRQMLHRSKKKNPKAIVVATGCYVQAQEDSEQGQIDECIDIVVGNNRKKDLVKILHEYEENNLDNERIEAVIDINHTLEYEEMSLSHVAEHTRAYIKVQDGCNQFCSYCIIPFARGRVRSRALNDVAAEVETLARNGYQEIVLTGIHLSSYGVDFTKPEEGAPVGLLDLIRMVHGIDGIQRIRLGSLEPGIITDEFARELSGMKKVCPHFHLSLQSGCEETLNRMNRKYSAKEYEKKCKLLRKYFNHPALTTDIIVGFPGETVEEFEASRMFVDRINFYETHIFKYSRRQGTKAADMGGQVEEKEKTRRSKIMLELNEKKQKAYETMFVGQEVEVLIEEQQDICGKTYQIGHTKEYIKLGIESEKNLQNQFVHIMVDNHSQIIH